MTAAPLTPPRPIHWAGTITLGIIWGTAFMGMSVALEGLPALWVAAGRLTIGGLTLLLVDHLIGNRDRPLRHAPLPWRHVWAIAVLSAALPFVLLTWGLQTVPSAFAGVSMAAVTLFVLPLAHVFVPGESLTLRRMIGICAGFVGVVLLIGPGAFAGGADTDLLPGRLACLAAALCYAVSSILTRRCPPVDAIRLASHMTLLGAALVLPIALLVEGLPPAQLSWVPVLALLWIGIFPTGAANLIRVLIIRSAGPGFMSLTGYQVPVWAVIFGVVILNEPIRPSMLIALILILGGIAVTQMPTPKRRKNR